MQRKDDNAGNAMTKRASLDLPSPPIYPMTKRTSLELPSPSNRSFPPEISDAVNSTAIVPYVSAESNDLEALEEARAVVPYVPRHLALHNSHGGGKYTTLQIDYLFNILFFKALTHLPRFNSV